MEAKHTPGPWKFDELDIDIPIYAGEDCVATVWGIGEATETNARLIAAAPDLLDKVQMVIALIDLAAGNHVDWLHVKEDLEKVVKEAQP